VLGRCRGWGEYERVSGAGIADADGDDGEDLGFLGMVLAGDQPASSALTRELLGWRPVQPGLIEDLDKGRYFA